MRTLKEIEADWAELKRVREIRITDDIGFTEQHAQFVGEAYKIEDAAIRLSRKILDEGYPFFKEMEDRAKLEKERNKKEE